MTNRSLQAQILLSLVSKRLQEESNRFFAEIGLSSSQFDIMRILWSRDNLTLSDLSRSCCCAPPNITGLVDRLEKKGLLSREADPEDRRVTRIRLTAEGRAIAGPARQAAGKYLVAFEEAFTSDELLLFVQLLEKLYRYWERETADEMLETLARIPPMAAPSAE